MEIILMVGGFLEFFMLWVVVMDRFLDKRVIILNEFGLFVMKGVVLFGFNIIVIVFRICKYMYGISVRGDFCLGIDLEEKKVMVRGRFFCKDRFSKYVEVG